MTAPLLVQGAFRLVLRLYPVEFRRSVGSAMMADLRHGWAQRRRTRGVVAALAFGARQIFDLIGNVGREWRSPSGSPVPSGRRGPTAAIRSLFQDLRFAARSLRRDPKFSLTVILVVSLGIGALVTVYGMLEAILLEPLPYPGAERIVSLSESYRVSESKSVAYPNYLDWRARNRVFEDIAARTWGIFNLTGREGARTLRGHGATHNLFDLFGVGVAEGRFLSAADEEEAAAVVVVTDGFAQATFGDGESALGREIRLDGELYTIVGVAPSAEEFPFAGAELWLPLTRAIGANSTVDRTNHPGIEGFARIREGLTVAQAQADLDRVAAELAAEFPDTNAEAGVLMDELQPRVVGDAPTTLWVLLAAVATVLLGICANVASLMLARATRRGGEMAVRAALGAGRARLARQLIMEGAVIATVAAALGLGVASVLLGAVRRSASVPLPRLSRLDLDPTVALFAVGVSVVAALLFSGLPALRMLRAEPAASLRASGGSRGATSASHTGRTLLVAAQVALAVMLLAGAGLMLRTVANLARADTGLDPGHVVTGYVGPPQTVYPENDDRVRLYRALADRVAALPGVQRVSGGDPLPMSGRNNQWTLSNEGFPQVDDGGLRVDVARVMPEYFDVMGIDVLAGRDFREDDGPEAPVVIVDRTLADFLFPDREALGQQVRFRGPPEERPWHTIVGVVEHVKNYGVRNESRYELYLPYTLSAWGTSMLVEATPGAPVEEIVRGLRAELAALDPELPLTRVTTVADNISSTVEDEALLTRTLAGFAAAAMAVAMIGLYGAIAYSVALRTREFGIRMALGAGRRSVLGGVLGEGLRLAAIGVGVGVLGALLLGRLLTTLLYGVSAVDPVTLGSAAAVMVMVTLAATWVPARQAVGVDPAVALRD